MSWQVFKNNILRVANNPESLTSIETVANLYATEYDLAIKRGGDTISKIPVVKGNVEAMKNLFVVAFTAGQASFVPYDLIGALGPGVLAYWQGAEFSKFPIPLIPAVGSVLNVSITSMTCTTPGTWNPAAPLPPNNNPGLLIDLFIANATAHLSSVSGIVNTISLYPPLSTPGPGIINWSGYFVPPAGVSVSAPPAVSEFKMTQEDIAVKKEEIKKVEKELEDNTKAEEPDKDLQDTGQEYLALLQKEVTNEEFNSTDYDDKDDDFNKKIEITNSDVSYNCDKGKLIVEKAKADIGILETGTKVNKGAGLNYGGKKNPNGEHPVGVYGRIDDMIRNAGLNNPQKVERDGSGYYWCAAAVTTWWKEAGFPTPPGSAACTNWASWAKKKGLYSKVPCVGAAVLYGPEGAEHHIGIVASVVDGKITTIEGNTGGGGFNRNGCGCFLKTPNKRNISGYVIPPGCNK